ncbi:MAG: ABC transporter ATP-binding protein [Gammaproteobacteria bacterium]|nr:ABC transporter ATP-binding protein [Gammaproteobacteria bacterium]
MLKLRGVEACYGSSQALFGVDLELADGSVTTLLGRNGMGKTTVVRSIMGMLPLRAGVIRLEGREIQRLPSYAIARLGIGLVPEGRRIFPNLTLRENLLVAAANYAGASEPYTMEHVLSIFPKLSDRLNHFGNQLSGGEQQMLAVARALMINPRVLILDEATEGLAPLIRAEIWRGLTILKEKGQTILVIDKNIDALLRIADHHHIMENGRVVWSGSSSQLAADKTRQSRYLGV